LFDVLGLGKDMVHECFDGAISLIPGLSYEDVEERLVRNHHHAYELNITKKLFPLEIGGFYKYIDGQEYHDYHPHAIHAIHKATVTADGQGEERKNLSPIRKRTGTQWWRK
jgi:glutamate synthase (NADPH/NADH) large chain